MKKTHLINILSIIVLLSTSLKSFSQTFFETDLAITPGVSQGSVDWGDFNNDGYLDILMIGSNNVRIFENNGDNTFTELAGTTFDATTHTSGRWVDFDNDGFLDIVYEGGNGFNNILRVYKNEGDETFTEKLSLGYLSNYGNNLDPGDIDNDGDIDFILTMSTKLVIFENIGGFTFVQHEESVFQDLEHIFCLLRDFDNDGRLDILLTGDVDRNVVLIYKNLGSLNFVLHSTSEAWAKGQVNIGDCGDYNGDGYLDLMIVRFYGSVLYTNNGDGTFPTYPTGYLGIAKDGESKFGDLDNDGDLDIVSSEYYQSNIYINDGAGNFSNAVNFGIPFLSGTAISFIDYDDDGDLDFVFTGHESPHDIFKFFQNDLATVNNPPDSPAGLSSTVDGDEIILNWDPPADDFTNDSALSYNVVIGSISGGDDIVKPLPSGSAIGNAQLSRNFRIRNIPQGTYYWSVQAIDNSLSKGAFSIESTFYYSSSIQSYALNTNDIEGSETSFSWSRGNGEHSIVFMKESAGDDPLPVDNSTYTADGQYGLGSQIGTTGWFCVYNGDLQRAKVTGLSAQTEYKIVVMEFSGSPGNEGYNTEASENNSHLFTTGKFTEIKGLNLPTLNGNSLIYVPNSDALWFDFDNDEDLDLFTVGGNGSFLYRNDGSENFVNTGFTAYGYEMVSVCDYNNDGFLDLSLGGGSFVGIYSNNGDNTFSILPGTTFQSVSNGSIDWFDYDNDGDADLLLSGQRSDNSENASIIYKNNGDSTFSETSDHQIPAMKNSTADWGDFNNDGFLDVAISGTNIEGANKTLILKNDSLGHFILQQELQNTAGTVSWGDYDSDGFLDLLLVSWDGNYIYKNNGVDSLVIQDTINLALAYDEDGEWVDYDSDGDLDVITSGYNSREPYTKIFENKGSNSFVIDTLALLTPAGFSTLAWGDFDKDGDLDLFLSGNSTDSAFSKIFRNEINNVNPAPTTINGLATSVEKSSALLSWDKVISDNTSAPAMTYNLRVGTSTGAGDITSTLSASNGYRKVAATGNAGQDTVFKLKNLPLGDYYWSVQAVDNGYSGGAFAAEQSFSIVPVQAKNLSAKIIANNSLLLKWERGNGSRVVVFCKETNADLALPVNDDIYLPDNEYGYGDQLGSTGWYCVYNGRSDSAIVSGLTYRADYSFHVIEYLEEDAGKQYFPQLVNGNPGVFSTGLFSEQSSIILNFPAEGVDWGDYDNDGYVDLLIPGQPSRIYKNNGDNTFTEVIPVGLPDLYDGQAIWGDYDNDGDLDFFAFGRLGADHYVDPAYAALYRNDAGVFTEESSFTPTPMHIGYADWGDLDYDNDLDLIVMGATAPYPNYAPVTQVFQNNGDGTFTELATSLPDLYTGTAEWLDYDNDGYLDIYIEGVEENNYIQADLFRNNGDNTFVRQTQFDFMHHDNGEIAWADFDKDGDQDILQINARYTIISLYENRGDNFVQILSERHYGGTHGAISWGDYDNDGYLDIIFGNFGPGAIFYKNINGESFEAQSDASTKFADVQGLEWCDYDNDGDIDMLVSKQNKRAAIYKNNTFMNSGTFAVNKKAHAPEFISASPSPGGVSLNWSPVTNDESPSATLSYNLRIGTSYDSTDILSPIADSSGFRLIPRLGNAFLDTTFLVKGLSPGKYYWSVQGIDQSFQGGSWSKTDSFEIKNLQPFFDFDTVCFGLATTFIDQTVSSDTITSWQWIFEDGAIATEQNPTHIFSSAGVKQVKLKVLASGFTDSLTQNIFVMPKPTAGFSTANICQGSSASFTNTSLPEGSTISNWYWDFGDGKSSASENPAPNGYLNTGDYKVKLTAYADNGCFDSIVKPISVAAFPSATIATASNPEFCAGDNLKLSVPENSNYIYQWKIGGAAIAAADSSVYLASGPGDHTVSVTNPLANCVSHSLSPVSISVIPAPSQPLIQADRNTTFCDRDSVKLSVSNISGYNYQWKLNGGAIGSNSNTLIAKTEGTYSLLVTNESGCNATSSNTMPVTVLAKPAIPIVSVSGSKIFCEGSSIRLQVDENTGLNYQWMEGTDYISGAESFTYDALSSGNYKLLVSNNEECSSESQITRVTVNPLPSRPTILYSGATEFCDEEVLELSFTNLPGNTYEWLFNGNRSGVNTTNFLAENTGNYSVLASNELGCSSSSTNSVNINVLPSPRVPLVDQNGLKTFCAGGSLILTVPDAGGTDSYQWMNSNTPMSGKTGTSLTITETGTYNLRIKNANLCEVFTPAISVQVNPVPGKPFIVTENYEENGCKDIDPIIMSLSNTQAGIDYQWIKNDSLIEDQTGSIYEDFLDEGNYKIRASQNSCINESDLKIIKYAPMPPTPEIIVEGPVVWYLACSNDSAFDYNWYYNNTLIDGANDHIYAAGSRLGEYKVGVSDQSCYSFSEAIRIPLGTGIEQNPFENLKIYPNPTSGKFSLEMDNPIMGELQIDINNIAGSKILNIKFLKETSHFQTQIDLSGQAAAMYLINIVLDEYHVTKRLLVE